MGIVAAGWEFERDHIYRTSLDLGLTTTRRRELSGSELRVLAPAIFLAGEFVSATGYRQERKEKRDRATNLTLSEIAYRERFRALTSEEAAARSRLVARDSGALARGKP